MMTEYIEIIVPKQNSLLVDWEGKTSQKIFCKVMNAVVVVSRAKQWQDTSPLVILLYTLQGEISLVPLSMLEFVLWLFIHNCTTSMLSFTLEEEKEKIESGEKSNFRACKETCGNYCASISVCFWLCLHLFLSIILSNEKTKESA